MSSYMSGIYDMEQRRRRQVVAQCEYELSAARAALAEHQNHLQAVLAQRARRQAEMVRQEQAAGDRASRTLAEATARRRGLDSRVRALLHTVQDKTTAAEKAGHPAVWRERMQVLQNSFSLFGASEQLARQLEMLEEQLNRLPPRPAPEAGRRARHQPADVQDRSRTFISLHTEPAGTGAARATPWQQFMDRLQKLCAAGDVLTAPAASAMLEKARQTAPSQQNLFVLRHREELAGMEQAAAARAAARQDQARQKEALWNTYLALCLLREQDPQLTEQADGAELERENDRLFREYQKEKERQYITNVLTQVLERHGIAFESLEPDGQGTVQLCYHLENGAELHVSRSDAGAFEMEFAGVTAGQQASLDDKRRVTEQARSFCSLLPRIGEELRQRGILFDQVEVQVPSEENIRFRHRQGRSGQAGEQKARELPL